MRPFFFVYDPRMARLRRRAGGEDVPCSQTASGTGRVN